MSLKRDQFQLNDRLQNSQLVHLPVKVKANRRSFEAAFNRNSFKTTIKKTSQTKFKSGSLAIHLKNVKKQMSLIVFHFSVRMKIDCIESKTCLLSNYFALNIRGI